MWVRLLSKALVTLLRLANEPKYLQRFKQKAEFICSMLSYWIAQKLSSEARPRVWNDRGRVLSCRPIPRLRPLWGQTFTKVSRFSDLNLDFTAQFLPGSRTHIVWKRKSIHIYKICSHVVTIKASAWTCTKLGVKLVFIRAIWDFYSPVYRLTGNPEWESTLPIHDLIQSRKAVLTKSRGGKSPEVSPAESQLDMTALMKLKLSF